MKRSLHKVHSYATLVLIGFATIITLASCDAFTFEDQKERSTVLQRKEITGTLSVPPGATLPAEDTKVITFAQSAGVEQDGKFTVEAVDSEKHQVLIFNDKSTQQPVYLGLYDPAGEDVTAGINSTAKALTLFNPYLIYTDQQQRAEYLEAVQQQENFSELVSLLETAYQNNASTALSQDENPQVYQMAAQLMKATMEELGGAANMQENTEELNKARLPTERPYIEDAPGEKITFVNPRHVSYGAGVRQEDEQESDLKIVHRQETVASLEWGWPPITSTEPKETEHGLGNGRFVIRLDKGDDFGKFTQWDDPGGRATLFNMGTSIQYGIEIALGELLEDIKLAELGEHLDISAERSYQLARDAQSKNIEQFLTHFYQLIADNADEIAAWIQEEVRADVSEKFLEVASEVFTRASFVLEVLGYLNEQLPFLADWLLAPDMVSYTVTQEGGTITSQEENEAPEAAFSIIPPAGVVGTTFGFDASSTTDDQDALTDLRFRWDWESDGNWDTGWQRSASVTHSYAEADAYTVTLQAEDQSGLVGSVTHIVNVGGGEGTASHVKLFRDNLPWESNATVEVLREMGFTEGTGPGTYEIIGSDQMSTVSLTPGEDLAIISNDQKQSFYDTYAENQIRFTNFVYAGGSLLWGASDEGWAGGSLKEAGVVLPGNLETNLDLDNWNYVTDPNLPLVEGLPEDMDHNYASHESFSGLPDGATIYTVNEEEEPTLVEFSLGGGWVMLTGQPLEHQYDRVYGTEDMENMLPRIISYFTGQGVPAAIQEGEAHPLVRSERPSSNPQ